MTTLVEDQVAYARLYRKNQRVQRYAKTMREREAAAEQALWERMETEHDKSHRIDGVGLITRKDPTWYAQVQDRGAFMKWALANRPGLVREAEEKGLLNALVSERIRDNQPLPPGLGAYPKNTVSVRR